MAINVNVLEACHRTLPNARLTNILSYCMYPSTEHPHPESELWGHEPEDYLFAYALTKKALLIGSRAYRQEFGMNCASLVLPTVYGPGDSFAENSHVMGALVGKFVRAARDGLEEVEVWGDGRQQREFLFVEDAADGIVAVALRSKADVVNIGAGQAHEIGMVASSIGKAAGFTGRVRMNENRFVGVRKRQLDVTRAREELGWSARTSIEDGIRKTVDWYRNQLGSAQRRPQMLRDGAFH
jgi:GDP-L-fucose synthase